MALFLNFALVRTSTSNSVGKRATLALLANYSCLWGFQWVPVLQKSVSDAKHQQRCSQVAHFRKICARQLWNEQQWCKKKHIVLFSSFTNDPCSSQNWTNLRKGCERVRCRKSERKIIQFPFFFSGSTYWKYVAHMCLCVHCSSSLGEIPGEREKENVVKRVPVPTMRLATGTANERSEARATFRNLN